MESSFKKNNTKRRNLNIVLIGMPGSGKTTVGRLLSEICGMPFIDVDEEIEKTSGMSVEEIFSEYGEARFRRLETEETEKAGRLEGAVIATGGGVVKNACNYRALAENGRIYLIQRNISELATKGRPLSKDANALAEMYKERLPLYLEFADCAVSEGDPTAVAEYILKDFAGGGSD